MYQAVRAAWLRAVLVPLEFAALRKGATTMNNPDDNTFRPKLRAPRDKQARPAERFTHQVLRSINRGGPRAPRGADGKPRYNLSRHGRGAAASAFASLRVGPRSRRVVIKTRIVNLRHVTPQAV